MFVFILNDTRYIYVEKDLSLLKGTHHPEPVSDINSDDPPPFVIIAVQIEI